MSQRLLLSLGVIGIAAAVLIGVAAAGTGNGGSMMSWFGISSGRTISMDQAQQSAQSFLDRSGDSDLKIDELMEFESNFYVLVKEKSTGVGAFELLVNRANGAVAFEPGPTMMWNTKYSMMGWGMMRGGYFQVGAVGGTMPVGPDRATEIAQTWLNQNLNGDAAGTPDAFYGYYTFHFEKGGQIAGMLSVNGYSGAVWFHSWHGRFIQARDLGA